MAEIPCGHAAIHYSRTAGGHPYCTIGALKTFAPVYLLTKGGPGTATTVPSYYSYNQFFQVQQVGYGAAISTALTVVIIVFSIVFTMVQKHVEKELV